MIKAPLVNDAAWPNPCCLPYRLVSSFSPVVGKSLDGRCATGVPL